MSAENGIPERLPNTGNSVFLCFLACQSAGWSDTIVDSAPGNSLELVWCPPGTYMMGSPEGELGRYDAREAQHQVTLTKGFWIGKYDVTKEQF